RQQGRSSCVPWAIPHLESRNGDARRRGSYRELPDRTRHRATQRPSLRLLRYRLFRLAAVPNVQDFDNQATLAIRQYVRCDHQPPGTGRTGAGSTLRKVDELLLSRGDTASEASRGARIALGQIAKLAVELSPSAPNENNLARHYLAARLSSAWAII